MTWREVRDEDSTRKPGGFALSGGYGSPALGSAEIGGPMFDRLINDLARIVAAFRSMDVRAHERARV
jgi:hypothetical protein